ncbi:nucleotidyltransferase domain-containing protein [Actinomarinicola tropica]|uniref:Polymerase nucleotidyl transferase domain-containing protein n=1 Tax=Actinomarinicola tropica TaxID=2789776 RepID=A0A5Q2RFZ0_9ACTN|nr:nucleotidyltransferase domain-containing protein [Actinomarinicola tropica]QGG93722.1 hypothetical protein GH723_00570 [Actinomarinicola tropica]
MSRLPDTVRPVVERFVRLTAEHVPDLVEGVHLVGSTALDDHRDGVSDVDAVVVVHRRPSTVDLDGLRLVHRQLDPPRPFDAIYVLRSDLAADPSQADTVPFAHEGEVHADGAFEANPATWLTLRDHPLTVHGVPLTRDEVWCDPAVVRRWCRENLDGYWTELLQLWRAVGADMPDDQLTSPYGLAWGVLGPLRLLFTIDTLTTTSKSGAGRWARDRVAPHLGPVVDMALAVRSGQPVVPYAPPPQVWSDGADLIEWVIGHAASLPPNAQR